MSSVPTWLICLLDVIKSYDGVYSKPPKIYLDLLDQIQLTGFTIDELRQFAREQK